jgi:hypothetical protein
MTVNLDSVLDKMSKVVGIFGIVLGIAYVYGLGQSYFLYSQLDAAWVVGLLEPQALINIGLPSALLFLFAGLFVFVLIPSTDQLSSAVGVGFPVFTSGCIAFSMALKIFGIEVSDFYADSLISTAIFAAVNAALFAWALRLLFEGQQGRIVMTFFMAVGFFSFLMIPYMQAVQKSRGLIWGDKGTPLVIDKDSKILGVLVGSVAEKFVVLNCTGKGREVFLSDVSPDLKVRPSTGECG